jgi:hypothetical protein
MVLTIIEQVLGGKLFVKNTPNACSSVYVALMKTVTLILTCFDAKYLTEGDISK